MSTPTPDALDARLPLDQLDAAAQARLRRVETEAKALNVRLQLTAQDAVLAPADASWQGRGDYTDADMLGMYFRGLADASQIEGPVAFATGQAYLARDLHAAEVEWRGIVNRSVAGAAEGPSYADLCERRGEFDRAERARKLLAERSIA